MSFYHPTVRTIKWLTSHPALLFLCWSLWLTFPYFAFGPTSYVRIFDNAEIVLSLHLGLAFNWLHHQLGYWHPQLMSGVDTLSSGQIIPLAGLLFPFLPGWLAYGLFTWLQRFVAGYFTFRLLKDSLQVGTLISIYAGFNYSLFAQNSVNFSWNGFTLYDGLGLPGLPFLLWAFSRIDTEQRYRSYVLATGLGILFAASIHYSYAPFVLMAVLFWFWLVQPKLKLQFLILLVIFVGVFVVSELPVLWATVLNNPLSHRADRSPNWYFTLSQALLRAVMIVIWQIKENAIPLILTGVGLFASRWRDRRLIILTGGIVFCLLWTVIYPPIGVIQHNLGLLSGFNFHRFYCLTPFLVTVSGAIGLQWLGRFTQSWQIAIAKDMSYRYGMTVQTFLVLIVLGTVGWQSLGVQRLVFEEILNGSYFGAFYNSPDIEQLAENKKLLAPFRVATVTSFLKKPGKPYPGYMETYGLESVDGHLNLYPKRYQDYWKKVIAGFGSIDKETYGVFEKWGNTVYLFLPSRNSINFKNLYDLELLSLANVKYIISPVPLQDTDLKLLNSQAKIQQKKADLKAYQKLWWPKKIMVMLQGKIPDTPLYIYQNQEVLPRFFLVNKILKFETSEQILQALEKASFNQLRSTAYLKNSDLSPSPITSSLTSLTNSQESKVVLQQYNSDRITLQVKADSPAILVVTNSYSPYWQAKIDGKEVPIFPVDYTFQGIWTPEGQHEIVLEYAPPYALK